MKKPHGVGVKEKHTRGDRDMLHEATYNIWRLKKDLYKVY